MIDFLELQSKVNGNGKRVVPLAALWHVLIEGLNPIWPSRIQLTGKSLGDVWPCTVLSAPGQSEGDDLVAFHKLTSWLTYSIVEGLQKVAKWEIEGLEDLTGLPEYRNGNDRIADAIRTKLGLTSKQLTLAQVLESATWKGGREIAKKKRPETTSPPIEIESDGTVF
ncbi:hypothetical protein C0989_012332 [Termitomyces sp. Mn162]|nr:hypothetical protein C0989_012332 [Termitomyces sp. Mn162]